MAIRYPLAANLDLRGQRIFEQTHTWVSTVDDPDVAYAVGDLVTFGGYLYELTTALDASTSIVMPASDSPNWTQIHADFEGDLTLEHARTADTSDDQVFDGTTATSVVIPDAVLTVIVDGHGTSTYDGLAARTINIDGPTIGGTIDIHNLADVSTIAGLVNDATPNLELFNNIVDPGPVGGTPRLAVEVDYDAGATSRIAIEYLSIQSDTDVDPAIPAQAERLPIVGDTAIIAFSDGTTGAFTITDVNRVTTDPVTNGSDTDHLVAILSGTFDAAAIAAFTAGTPDSAGVPGLNQELFLAANAVFTIAAPFTTGVVNFQTVSSFTVTDGYWVDPREQGTDVTRLTNQQWVNTAIAAATFDITSQTAGAAVTDLQGLSDVNRLTAGSDEQYSITGNGYWVDPAVQTLVAGGKRLANQEWSVGEINTAFINNAPIAEVEAGTDVQPIGRFVYTATGELYVLSGETATAFDISNPLWVQVGGDDAEVDISTIHGVASNLAATTSTLDLTETLPLVDGVRYFMNWQPSTNDVAISTSTTGLSVGQHIEVNGFPVDDPSVNILITDVSLPGIIFGTVSPNLATELTTTAGFTFDAEDTVDNRNLYLAATFAGRTFTVQDRTLELDGDDYWVDTATQVADPNRLANQRYVDASDTHLIIEGEVTDATPVARDTLRFVGNGVNLSDNGSETIATITDTRHTIEDTAGTDFTSRNNLQFTGTGVVVTDDVMTDRTVVAITNTDTADQKFRPGDVIEWDDTPGFATTGQLLQGTVGGVFADTQGLAYVEGTSGGPDTWIFGIPAFMEAFPAPALNDWYIVADATNRYIMRISNNPIFDMVEDQYDVELQWYATFADAVDLTTAVGPPTAAIATTHYGILALVQVDENINIVAYPIVDSAVGAGNTVRTHSDVGVGEAFHYEVLFLQAGVLIPAAEAVATLDGFTLSTQIFYPNDTSVTIANNVVSSTNSSGVLNSIEASFLDARVRRGESVRIQFTFTKGVYSVVESLEFYKTGLEQEVDTKHNFADIAVGTNQAGPFATTGVYSAVAVDERIAAEATNRTDADTAIQTQVTANNTEIHNTEVTVAANSSEIAQLQTQVNILGNQVQILNEGTLTAFPTFGLDSYAPALQNLMAYGVSLAANVSSQDRHYGVIAPYATFFNPDTPPPSTLGIVAGTSNERQGTDASLHAYAYNGDMSTGGYSLPAGGEISGSDFWSRATTSDAGAILTTGAVYKVVMTDNGLTVGAGQLSIAPDTHFNIPVGNGVEFNYLGNRGEYTDLTRNTIPLRALEVAASGAVEIGIDSTSVYDRIAENSTLHFTILNEITNRPAFPAGTIYGFSIDKANTTYNTTRRALEFTLADTVALAGATAFPASEEYGAGTGAAVLTIVDSNPTQAALDRLVLNEYYVWLIKTDGTVNEQVDVTTVINSDEYEVIAINALIEPLPVNGFCNLLDVSQTLSSINFKLNGDSIYVGIADNEMVYQPPGVTIAARDSRALFITGAAVPFTNVTGINVDTGRTEFLTGLSAGQILRPDEFNSTNFNVSEAGGGFLLHGLRTPVDNFVDGVAANSVMGEPRQFVVGVQSTTAIASGAVPTTRPDLTPNITVFSIPSSNLITRITPSLIRVDIDTTVFRRSAIGIDDGTLTNTLNTIITGAETETLFTAGEYFQTSPNAMFKGFSLEDLTAARGVEIVTALPTLPDAAYPNGTVVSLIAADGENPIGVYRNESDVWMRVGAASTGGGVEILNMLPTDFTDYPVGTLVSLTAIDGDNPIGLYRSTGTAWENVDTDTTYTFATTLGTPLAFTVIPSDTNVPQTVTLIAPAADPNAVTEVESLYHGMFPLNMFMAGTMNPNAFTTGIFDTEFSAFLFYQQWTVNLGGGVTTGTAGIPAATVTAYYEPRRGVWYRGDLNAADFNSLVITGRYNGFANATG